MFRCLFVLHFALVSANVSGGSREGMIAAWHVTGLVKHVQPVFEMCSLVCDTYAIDTHRRGYT